MKKYTDFRSEQIHINEIGPVGATIMAVSGLIGGAFALKKGLDKFKGYRENRADKKARKKNGFDMKVKVLNPETGKEEEQEFYVDPKKGNKDLEKLTGGKFPERTLTGGIKAPTDDDLDKMEKQANRSAKRKNSEVKRKIATGKITDDDLTADQQAQLATKRAEKEKPPEDSSDSGQDSSEPESDKDERPRDKEGNLTDKKDAQDEFEKSGFKRAPDGWTKDPDNKKEVITKAEAEKKKQSTQGKVTGKDTSAADKLLRRNSRLLKFGEFIQEDVVSDLKKISKSKKDMEIKLGDGSEIPIDPMTADIFVKYIEGLKSSEQKRVINQIQRTERGFMKVLGKAHGE